jgi:hypothetical protein
MELMRTTLSARTGSAAPGAVTPAASTVVSPR